MDASLGELVNDLEALHDDLQIAEPDSPIRFEVWIGNADEPVIADEYLSIGASDGVVIIAIGAKG